MTPIKIRSGENADNTYDDKYVDVVGDTMTGALVVTTSGYSIFNGGIILKAGQKLIFDGE